MLIFMIIYKVGELSKSINNLTYIGSEIESTDNEIK